MEERSALIGRVLRGFGPQLLGTRRQGARNCSLLLAKLSDALSPQQKERKVGNLLSNLRRANRIFNAGSRAKPVWMLAESKAS